MSYLLLAEAIMVVHFGFILFVVFGGFATYRWPKIAWGHIPCALWGIWIELSGRVCPLTPLEVRFRRMGGAEGYTGGFVDHYLAPIIYPSGLTRTRQLLLGTLVLAINVIAYGILLRRRSTNPPASGRDADLGSSPGRPTDSAA